jgi:ubiquitin carboxyl-terminal hydrolase L5
MVALLQDFTVDFPPDIRGHTIGNADGIRTAHNSFAAPEAHLSDDKARKATEDDDVYHFVSYIHKNGVIWELDGLQQGPIRCCECSQVSNHEGMCISTDSKHAELAELALALANGTVSLACDIRCPSTTFTHTSINVSMHCLLRLLLLQDEWLDKIGGVIGERIALYSAKEIRFNLMALVKDHRSGQTKRIQEIEAQLQRGDNPELATERHHLQQALDEANSRHERWRLENIRRRHNYIPFIFNVFQILAERDELKLLLDKGKAAAKESSEKDNSGAKQ